MSDKDPSSMPLDPAAVREIHRWLRYPANRREFVRGGALALAFSLGLIPRGFGKPQPQRTGLFPMGKLGGTGADVSLLGIGTQILGENVDGVDEANLEATAVDVFSHAMENGITYFDTASGYKRAEEFLGKALKGRERDQFFIATKVWTNSYHGAKQAFERSLKRLGTETIDLLHIHDAGKRDMTHVLKRPSDKGYDPHRHGAWKYLEEQKQAGRVRFLGVTAHSGPDQFAQLIHHTHDESNEREKVDAVMVRMSYISESWHGFASLIPPLVKQYNLGAMIMKVFGGPKGFGRELNDRELREAVRYVRGYDWAHGCVIGCSSKRQVDRNMEWVQCPPMTPEEMAALRAVSTAANSLWEKRFEHYVSSRYDRFESVA